MAKSDTPAPRAPRGTKPVAQAFLAALEDVPAVNRAAVAKAAQAMVRDELKARREKEKLVAAKEKARAASGRANGAAPAKRRPRKAADTAGSDV